MRDIVVPDIDEAIEDEDGALQAGDGIGAAAVAALIATLLRDADMRGTGAMIVRWCDHGEQIEVEIAAWPSDAAPETAWHGSAMLDALFAEPRPGEASDATTTFDEAEADERPLRRDCASSTFASSRSYRRMRRR